MHSTDLLTAVLRGQSTTELRNRMKEADRCYGQLMVMRDENNAEIFKSVADMCAAVLATRVFFYADGEGRSNCQFWYTEWQPQTDKYGNPRHTFTLVKDKHVGDALLDMRVRREASALLARLNANVNTLA